MSVAEVLEKTRERYRNVEIRAYPDEKFVKACNELGGTVEARGEYDTKHRMFIINKDSWVCYVKRNQLHQEILDEVATVLEKYRPSGVFEFDLASGEMKLKTKDGLVDDFYAWYTDLGNVDQFIREEEVDFTDPDFWEWIENMTGVRVPEEERRKILDRAERYISAREYEELLNSEFKLTEGWENYRILSDLGLNMSLGKTVYGGIYPIIDGRNVRLTPDDLKKLKKVFEDFEDVRRDGYGNGLLEDLVEACTRAEVWMWVNAIKKAMKEMGYPVKE